MALYSRDLFAQTHEVTTDILETQIDLRKAAIDLREASTHFRKAAAKLGPDIRHIAALLRLPLKNRTQQKSDRGDRPEHLSDTDPCALNHSFQCGKE